MVYCYRHEDTPKNCRLDSKSQSGMGFSHTTLKMGQPNIISAKCDLILLSGFGEDCNELLGKF
jgi:hypothetical protein